MSKVLFVNNLTLCIAFFSQGYVRTFVLFYSDFSIVLSRYLKSEYLYNSSYIYKIGSATLIEQNKLNTKQQKSYRVYK